MEKPKFVYVIYRDGQIARCFIDEAYRDKMLLHLMKDDKGNHYKWSTAKYDISHPVS